MQDSTEILTHNTDSKVQSNESHILSISVRSQIVLLLVLTVCVMALKTMKVEEPLYTLVTVAVGYYFGQNTKPKSQGGENQQ